MVVLSAFSAPSEGIHLREENVHAHVSGKGDLGNGTLFIAESKVSWLGGERSEGFSLEYPAISLYAVSKDLSSFPSECLYLHVDGDVDVVGFTEDGGGDAGSDDEEDVGPSLTEVRFVPNNKESLPGMYQAMTDCQLLHPDPDDSNSEEEEEEYYDDEGEEAAQDAGGEYYQSAEDAQNLTPQGRATLQHLDNLLSAGTQGIATQNAQVNGAGVVDSGMETEDNNQGGGSGGGDQFEDAMDH